MRGHARRRARASLSSPSVPRRTPCGHLTSAPRSSLFETSAAPALSQCRGRVGSSTPSFSVAASGLRSLGAAAAGEERGLDRTSATREGQRRRRGRRRRRRWRSRRPWALLHVGFSLLFVLLLLLLLPSPPRPPPPTSGPDGAARSVSAAAAGGGRSGPRPSWTSTPTRPRSRRPRPRDPQVSRRDACGAAGGAVGATRVPYVAGPPHHVRRPPRRSSSPSFTTWLRRGGASGWTRRAAASGTSGRRGRLGSSPGAMRRPRRS